jgi:uncharacterized protein YbaR (Trm112 family)
MLTECPHCQHSLKLSDSQQEKISKAVATLSPGKFLKLGCPHCHKTIELNKDGAIEESKAQSVTPVTAPPVKPGKKVLPPPPGPPDIDWLQGGEVEEEDILEDITQVLFLFNPGEDRDKISQAFEEFNYKAVYAESADDAIEIMRFVNFAAVVLEKNYEGDLARSRFHAHMRAMAMPKRRYIFYVLVGPDANTLYDLEALSNSVNLVVNNKDLDQFKLILKKGLHDYDKLFGPFINMLKECGRK